MSLLDYLRPKPIVKEVVKEKVVYKQKRGFDSARFDRLTADFIQAVNSLNRDIGSDLTAMRNRSRTLYKSNDYYKRCIELYVKYVIGNQGITLVNRAKNEKGEEDRNANETIEKDFKSFGDKNNFTLNKTDSLYSYQNFIVRCKARDGETFTRKHKFVKTKYGIAYSYIEPELLDEKYNVDNLPNGHYIAQGIEFDKSNNIIAYHFNNPNDMKKSYYYGQQSTAKIIIPANEIIHDFNKVEPNQIRGFPMFQGIMIALYGLASLNESEMVNYRYSSCKVATIERDYPDESQFKGYSGEATDMSGKSLDNLEPGEVWTLEDGEHLNFISPDHKTGNWDLFQKGILRSVASGGDLPYCLVSNDYSGMDEISIRLQRNDLIDFAMKEQRIFSENWFETVYQDFMKFSFLKQTTNLPFSKIDIFLEHELRGRSFQPLKPLEEAQANKINWENAGNSRTNYHRSLNQDTYDIFSELGNEEKLSRQFKISIRNQGGTASDNVGQPSGGKSK